MPNPLKDLNTPLTITRVFTRPDRDAYAWIHFQKPDFAAATDDSSVVLERPDSWTEESSALLGERAAFRAIPTTFRKPVEENTVPSWLWQRHQLAGAGPQETSVGAIVTRVVGAATYNGWKMELFANEDSARAFFDEARYALAQRFITIDPAHMANIGTAWAYGVDATATATGIPSLPVAPTVVVSHTAIDAIVSGSRDKQARTLWNTIVRAEATRPIQHVCFVDEAAAAPMAYEPSFSATIDLMACRHNDGAVNIESLQQLTRLLVMIADMNGSGATNLAIGFSNLAPLLMALAIPYDSAAARAMAASLMAILSAESYVTSARLAGLRGASSDFTAHRSDLLRSIRNHRRAAYGEHNDYEKTSILPVPLDLASCPDLALVAAARAGWDAALQNIQHHGLRHGFVTALTVSPQLTLLSGSVTQGIEPMPCLTLAHTDDGATFSTAEHPSVSEALARLGYDATQSQSLFHQLMGHKTLHACPHINPSSLRALGFDDAAIERVESYIPQAKNLRFAITPWIVGIDFCRAVLNVTDQDLADPCFDLLTHLGFSSEKIQAANGFCYGRPHFEMTHPLRAADAAVFATKDHLTTESLIRMAAAVQSFTSGEVGLHLSLAPNLAHERVESLVLAAWRQGVKSLSLAYDAAPVAEIKPARNRIKPSRFAQVSVPPMPARTATRNKPKAHTELAAAPSRGKGKISGRHGRGEIG